MPGGRRVPLDYGRGRRAIPVLAVRVQEMFGTRETPTVAGGRLPVVLHLLSPAGRPVQVTSDLAGFWSGSWQEVRKEMAGRYPARLAGRPGKRRQSTTSLTFMCDKRPVAGQAAALTAASSPTAADANSSPDRRRNGVGPGAAGSRCRRVAEPHEALVGRPVASLAGLLQQERRRCGADEVVAEAPRQRLGGVGLEPGQGVDPAHQLVPPRRRRRRRAAPNRGRPHRPWPPPGRSGQPTASWAASRRIARSTSRTQMFSLPSQMGWHWASRSWRVRPQSSQ